jgi:hypothetical protein
MELVEVEILTQTITAQYGVLSQGDILRTSAAFASHLVKDAFAAKYVHAKDDAPVLTRADLDAALATLPGENTDPDYVVRAMRSHFGDLFRAEDEARVRELVKGAASKPSDGLKVDELKAALEAKKIPVPEGAKKQDLADLLDGAA